MIRRIPQLALVVCASFALAGQASANSNTDAAAIGAVVGAVVGGAVVAGASAPPAPVYVQPAPPPAAYYPPAPVYYAPPPPPVAVVVAPTLAGR